MAQRGFPVASYAITLLICGWAFRETLAQAGRNVCSFKFPEETVLQVFPVKPPVPASPCNPALCRGYRDNRWSVLVRTRDNVYWLYANTTLATTFPSGHEGDECLQLVQKYHLPDIIYPPFGTTQHIQWVSEFRMINPNVSCFDSCTPLLWYLNVSFIDFQAVLYASPGYGVSGFSRNLCTNDIGQEAFVEFVDYVNPYCFSGSDCADTHPVFVAPQIRDKPILSLFVDGFGSSTTNPCGTMLANNRLAPTVEGVAASFPIVFRSPKIKSEAAYFLDSTLQQTSLLLSPVRGVVEFACSSDSSPIAWTQNVNNRAYFIVYDLTTGHHRTVTKSRPGQWASAQPLIITDSASYLVVGSVLFNGTSQNLVFLHPPKLASLVIPVGQGAMVLRRWPGVGLYKPPLFPFLLSTNASVSMLVLNMTADDALCSFFTAQHQGESIGNKTICAIAGKCTCQIGQKCCQSQQGDELPFLCQDPSDPDCAIEPIECSKLGTCGCQGGSR